MGLRMVGGLWKEDGEMEMPVEKDRKVEEKKNNHREMRHPHEARQK